MSRPPNKTGHKDCTKCKENKVLAEFHRQGGYYSAMCKICYSAYMAARQREARSVAILDKGL